MFTGIVQATGTVAAVRPSGSAASIDIASSLDLTDISIGDSICVNGICLTVTGRERSSMSFDLSPETIRVAAAPRGGEQVNLEKALRLSDRLGGHLVTGHVDGVGEVVSVEKIGDNTMLSVRFPQMLGRYIAVKGSIALHGVSLTVNAVSFEAFTVNLIPHTLTVTNLKLLAPGSRVNLEVDPIARYVERMVTPAQ
jgi:riboflavin synthase